MNYPVLKINNYQAGPTAPLFMAVADESEIQAKVLREEQELTGIWGRMVTDTVVGPGYCIQYSMCYIKAPVTLVNVASQPVLTLHLQAKHDLPIRMDYSPLCTIREDEYGLFAQGDNKVSRSFAPGDYLLLNGFFTPHFLTAHMAHIPLAQRYREQTQYHESTPTEIKKASVDHWPIIDGTNALNRLFRRDARLTSAYTPVVMELLANCIQQANG